MITSHIVVFVDCHCDTDVVSCLLTVIAVVVVVVRLCEL